MPLFVVPRIGAYQYDGTNADLISANLNGTSYEVVEGVLHVTDLWGNLRVVEPMTQYACYGTLYQTLAELREAYYILPDEVPA